MRNLHTKQYQKLHEKIKKLGEPIASQIVIEALFNQLSERERHDIEKTVIISLTLEVSKLRNSQKELLRQISVLENSNAKLLKRITGKKK